MYKTTGICYFMSSINDPLPLTTLTAVKFTRISSSNIIETDLGFLMSKHKPIALFLIVTLKCIILLPWINIAIVIKRISNADLCTINQVVGCIFTDGDYDGVDCMCF